METGVDRTAAASLTQRQGLLLSGKVAVVTGGASGIGRAICEVFVEEGARVAVADIDAGAAGAVANLLNGEQSPLFTLRPVAAAAASASVAAFDAGSDPSHTVGGAVSAGGGNTCSGGGGAWAEVAGRGIEEQKQKKKQEDKGERKALCVKCDVRRRDDIAAALGAAEAAFGGVDVVVNCAAVQNVKGIEATSDAEWDDVMATNLTSVFHATQLATPYLRRRGGGSIVNVASTFALVGSPGYAAYHAAKGGVLSLTRATAVQLLPYNIRVNAICPGTTHTPGLMRGLQLTCGPNDDPQQLLTSYLAKQPMGRFGRPREIAEVVAFLASERASFMVGASVVADGAYTIV